MLDAEQEAQPLGLLLELDGCIVDTASAGHREAFNRAFKVCCGSASACELEDSQGR